MKEKILSRIKNPVFWIGLFGVIAAPVLAYNGAELADFTTWESVGDIIVSTVKNPYLIGSIIAAVLGFLGVSVDTSTPGFKDGGKKEGEK